MALRPIVIIAVICASLIKNGSSSSEEYRYPPFNNELQTFRDDAAICKSNWPGFPICFPDLNMNVELMESLRGGRGLPGDLSTMTIRSGAICRTSLPYIHSFGSDFESGHFNLGIYYDMLEGTLQFDMGMLENRAAEFRLKGLNIKLEGILRTQNGMPQLSNLKARTTLKDAQVDVKCMGAQGDDSLISDYIEGNIGSMVNGYLKKFEFKFNEIMRSLPMKTKQYLAEIQKGWNRISRTPLDQLATEAMDYVTKMKQMLMELSSKWNNGLSGSMSNMKSMTMDQMKGQAMGYIGSLMSFVYNHFSINGVCPAANTQQECFIPQNLNMDLLPDDIDAFTNMYT